jgi:hypothetical protein
MYTGTIETSIDDLIVSCESEIERLRFQIEHWTCTYAEALKWSQRIRELRVRIAQLEREKVANNG